MMAMLDLAGTPFLPSGSSAQPPNQPTRFQECVIFHFLLTENRPESQEGQAKTGITQRRRRVERIWGFLRSLAPLPSLHSKAPTQLPNDV